MKFRCCGNNCIFCFIDQNPKNLRKNLYFKDEDFRLSFLYGNYVTLTNISRLDLERIVEQRLSPIFISVHATDTKIRKHMFGLKQDDHLMQKIDYLARNKIEMNAQIVLCPSINDGAVLDNTITTLAQFHPQIKTVAIVPVGLTKHRNGLPVLKAVDRPYSIQIVRWAEKRADRFKDSLNSYFVFLADEFYVLANHLIPPTERYEDFDQIENGVGMVRRMLDNFAEDRQRFPARMTRPILLTIVTGKLAEPIIKNTIAPALSSIINLSVQLIAVANTFYGDGVTVSGLLVGQDIYHTLMKYELGEEVWLSENCVNHDGLFLDDWSPEDLGGKLGVSVKIIDKGFLKALLDLAEIL
jgi:putative radical SAM enzyme (TIGR03279 family)